MLQELVVLLILKPNVLRFTAVFVEMAGPPSILSRLYYVGKYLHRHHITNTNTYRVSQYENYHCIVL